MANQQKGCDGKVRYLTKGHAREARRGMRGRGNLNSKGNMGRGVLTAYHCEFCDFWHLGHMPAAVRNGQVDKSDWLNQ